MQLADDFTQSHLHCIQCIYTTFIPVCVFFGNRTHNLGAASAMLYCLSNRNGLIQCMRIMYAYNARFKGGLDLPLLQQDPVDLFEERVDFDGFL